MRDVLGETTARATLGAFGYYTWVYREVLERPETSSSAHKVLTCQTHAVESFYKAMDADVERRVRK